MLVIVTGASRGIGFEMVKEFSKNSQNLVVAISRNPKSLDTLVKNDKSHRILPIKADLSDLNELKKAVKSIARLQMNVDVVVNNAGTLIKKKFEDISIKDLQTVYHTNVFVPFLLVQALLPYMDPKKGAHVVNIGSMGGVQGSSKFAGLSAYSSSKAALAGLSECMAEEFKPNNVHVNCLALGSVQTEMLSSAFPGYKAPLSANQMAAFICEFALNGRRFFNGKILPVSSSTP